MRVPVVIKRHLKRPGLHRAGAFKNAKRFAPAHKIEGVRSAADGATLTEVIVWLSAARRMLGSRCFMALSRAVSLSML